MFCRVAGAGLISEVEMVLLDVDLERLSPTIVQAGGKPRPETE